MSDTHGTGAADSMFELAESSQLEAIMSELESLTSRTYGQYCGLARALEIVGERWALLIVRDLLVSAKTFAQLQRGLPRMPVDILSTRLRELESAGVVHHDESAGGLVYDLTALGRELDDILLRMGRWGAKLLGDPQAEEIVTPDSMVMALRTTFNPRAAAGTVASYEIRLGDIVLNARIADGTLLAGTGPLPGADLTLEAGTSLRALMAGEISPAAALASETVRITGDPELLDRFAAMFHIPAATPA